MELSLGISPQDQSRHPQTPTTAARLSETVTRDSSISDSVIYRSVGLRLFTWYFQRSLSLASLSSQSTSGYNQLTASLHEKKAGQEYTAHAQQDIYRRTFCDKRVLTQRLFLLSPKAKRPGPGQRKPDREGMLSRFLRPVRPILCQVCISTLNCRSVVFDIEVPCVVAMVFPFSLS